jgi:hypothetical protein
VQRLEHLAHPAAAEALHDAICADSLAHDQPTHIFLTVPLTVVTFWHDDEAPYEAQSALLVQTVQQMSAPALLAAHHISGELGQSRLVEQVREHQPWPAPPLTHRPELHSLLSVHGEPSPRLVQKLDGEQICEPTSLVWQQLLTQSAF